MTLFQCTYLLLPQSLSPVKEVRKRFVSTHKHSARPPPSATFTRRLCKASLVSFRVGTSLLLLAKDRVMRMRKVIWMKMKNLQKRWSTPFHVG